MSRTPTCFSLEFFYEICSGIDGLVNNLPYELFTLKHNPNKTDPAYYTTMLAQYGLPVDDVVYFEHNKEAVKSARSVGITTHHYDREKKDVQALKVFLDEQLQ
jgi:methionine salvage enolase-phosphatase E1